MSSQEYGELVKSISGADGISLYDICENDEIDLSEYEIIGFASGIAKRHPNKEDISRFSAFLDKLVADRRG